MNESKKKDRYEDAKKFVRYSDGAKMYSMGMTKFQEVAKDAKACYKIGQLVLVNTEILDKYLETFHITDSKMAEVIGVSEAQLRFVTNTVSGMGLIKCGSVVIPFDNQISKDTDLYRLYNTNIHEKIAEQKKREMQNNVE